MFISFLVPNATPVLTAEPSPNGPAAIKVDITHSAYFYISVDQAYQLCSAILAAQSKVVQAEAARHAAVSDGEVSE